jgi:hypothetical protein
LKQPKRELTPLVVHHALAVLVFTEQMCWEINEFFNGQETENYCRRKRKLPTKLTEELE